MGKALLVVGILIVILVAAGLVAFKVLLGGSLPVTITYYGLWEPESVFQGVIDDFHRSHPSITVKYQKMTSNQYRERITGAMAGENGPDIVRIHNTWLPMMVNLIAPVPNESYSSEQFRGAFYPAANEDLTVGGRPYAVPLEIDTLVMYVNQDLMTAAGASVPTTWDDFSRTAIRLTVRDSNGRIQTAGTALGSASNVDHWQDIVTMMMLQAGVDLSANPGSQAAAEALGFYTGFQTANRVWDETLDASTLAFANGKVALYFGPSWRYFDVKNINPNLNFVVAPVPQLTGGKAVNLATYWAEAVSKKSKHQKEAWEFIKFISSKEELAKMYLAESKVRGFGEPYSRVEMSGLLTSDPVAGVVAAEAPTARSWYLASATNDGDTGVNSKISKYYLDAINSIIRGGQVRDALVTVTAGVGQVLGQYGVGSSGRN